MTKSRLTERRIRDARHDPDAITFIWDAGLPGFGLRISKTGVRAFVLWTRTGTKKRLLTLSRWPDLTLEGARKAATVELDAIASGKDDLLTRRAARRDAMTVAQGCAWFLDTYVPRRIGLGKMAERTAAEYGRQIKGYVLPALGHMKIASVTRQQVEAMLDGIGWHKPSQFSRVRSLVRSLFNLFQIEGWRTEVSNPATRIATPTERERTRVLTAEEQSAFLAALARIGDDSATLALKFLYETGCRLNEARTLRWSFVNAATATIDLPETKTGPKSIKATDAAMAVLGACQKVASNPFVFCGAGSAALAEKTIRRAFKEASRLAGLENFKIHDLRRSYITDAIGASIPVTTVANLVGHATIAMTARYAKAADAQVRGAAEQLAASRRAKRGAEVHALKPAHAS